jgi:hypothetical protein
MSDRVLTVADFVEAHADDFLVKENNHLEIIPSRQLSLREKIIALFIGQELTITVPVSEESGAVLSHVKVKITNNSPCEDSSAIVFADIDNPKRTYQIKLLQFINLFATLEIPDGSLT